MCDITQKMRRIKKVKKNMTKIKRYKEILIGISIFIFVLIIYLTLQIIYQNENWKWLDIDFSAENSNAISAYGTLIGGILAFLSIIFVIYSILEQNQQIITDKNEKERENQIELLNKIKLLNSFCKSAIENITSQGEKLEKFHIDEKKFPSKYNKIYFSTNNNFSRVIDLDALSIYKAIDFYFKNDDNKETIFLDLYSIFDFYYESLQELKQNFKIQLNNKYDEGDKICLNLDDFLNICIQFINKLDNIREFSEDIDSLKKLINKYKTDYTEYLKNNNEIDFNVIYSKFLQPFIDNGKLLPEINNLSNYSSVDLVNMAIGIKSKIKKIEKQNIDYADDIGKQFEDFYSCNCKNIIKLNEYRVKFNELTAN